MPTSNGMHSYDAALYVTGFNSPNPANVADLAGWTEIGDVISMNGVPMERSVTDVSHLRSPLKAKEKVPGFMDGGQLTVRLNGYKELITTLINWSPGNAGAPDASPEWGRALWAVYFPDDGVMTFWGFIKSQPFEIPEDNRVTVEVTLEVSGAPDFLAFA